MAITIIQLGKGNRKASIKLTYEDPFQITGIESEGDENIRSVYFFYSDEPRGYFVGEVLLTSAEWWINIAEYIITLHGFSLKIINPPKLDTIIGDEGMVY